MDTGRKLWFAGLLCVSSAVLGLSSCSGGQAQTVPSLEASIETSQATPNAAESSATGDASGPNDPLTSELAKGKEVPATWPSELPLPENETLVVVNDMSSLISLTWSVKSRESYTKLVEQYRKLPGWQENTSSYKIPNLEKADFTKDKMRVSISYSSQGMQLLDLSLYK
jgi:lipoprotein